jgi:hypothetical protein
MNIVLYYVIWFISMSAFCCGYQPQLFVVSCVFRKMPFWKDKAAKDVDSRTAVDVEGLKLVKNDVDLNISKDFEDLKSKLNMMDSKLREVNFF